MMQKYEIITEDRGSVIVRDNGNGTLSYIPMDSNNVDYVEYLLWLDNQA